MQFSYHPQAGQHEIMVEGELYRHLYLSRRTQVQDVLVFRNLLDDTLYFYSQVEVHKKRACLRLLESRYVPKRPTHQTHLIWALIAHREIEKVLPYLNQMGVCKISFFYAQYSQRGDFGARQMQRLERILIASNQQSGRSDLMALELFQSTQEVLQIYPHAKVLDFNAQASTTQLTSLEQGILIGPEGGFSSQERQLFSSRDIYSMPNPFVLTSEGAALLLGALVIGNN
ncbi:16S rRNA (uracil(1498)-N(3))-methyltransferase [Helicobacter baculiformis]|uniref:Ribosomal RNA small subunit methyltransferase E n=1 Tax=Helicobacter baculiformis TaxID=427351 RepID=A0ABV7ZK62_9HELI|nr:16S rRNA (uracil(1498)-N(3))-methyltransferase [Helicobacter baculiformis]